MCGLAGYITNKTYSREAQARFKRILLEAEIRGTDACGVAFVTQKNRFFYAKEAKKASEFVEERGYKRLIADNNPTILIGHNRAKTQGDQENNMNNHPIVTKTGLLLIHNGMVSNDDEVAKEFKLHLDGEVDSEVIVRLIEYYIYAKKKTTIKAIQLMRKHLRGSIAIALLNAKEPKTLYLMASDNPINLAYHIPTGTIYFASTEDILKNGLIEYDSYFGGLFYKARSKEEYVFEKVGNDTGLKITQKGWESFEVETPTWSSSSASVYNRDNKPSFKGRTIYTFEPSQKPVIVEAKGEADIIKALKEYTDFDVRDTIDKPSKYMSELLLYRLEMIQEEFISGDYLIWYKDPETDGKEFINLRNEVRRIIETLEQRQKKTKRTDIIIPDFEDVFLIENKKYGKVLENGNPAPNGFKDVKWILAHRNPKAMDLLTKAETIDKPKGKKKDKDEPDYYNCVTCRKKVFESPCPYCHYSPEPVYLDLFDSEKEEYYCDSCDTFRYQNLCKECGTINLPTADEYFGKMKEKQLALPN